MGCDFEMIGSQQDLEIQGMCLDFAVEWMGEIIPTGSALDFFGVHNSPVNIWRPGLDGKKLTVKREVRTIYRFEGELKDMLGTYPGVSPYTPDSLNGITELSVPMVSMPMSQLVFDNERGGILCRIVFPGDFDFRSEPKVKEGTIMVRAGTWTRFQTGKAALYVLAHALRAHFIPNLSWHADYDADLFEHRLDETGWTNRIARAGAKELASIVNEATAELQKQYDDNVRAFCERQEKADREREAAKVKKFEALSKEERSKILSTSVEELEPDLSVRTYNVLKNNDIENIGELVQYSEAEMLKMKNCGRKSLKELKQILEGHGLDFGLVIGG